MFETVRMTVKKLLNDKRGEDLAEVSSGLSKGAKVCITLGVVTATAAGAASLATTQNDTTDEASARIASPTGVQGTKTQKAKKVYE